MCGIERYGIVTNKVPRYVEIMQLVCALNGNYVLGPEEMSKFRADIRIFKTKAVDVFENVQTSGMGTVKWHLEDHVCDNIARSGGLYLNDAGNHEGSHKHFRIGSFTNHEFMCRRLRSPLSNYICASSFSLS